MVLRGSLAFKASDPEMVRLWEGRCENAHHPVPTLDGGNTLLVGLDNALPAPILARFPGGYE